jgi:MarR family transcriptional regulator, organic hydroperoxide resistance regulator
VTAADEAWALMTELVFAERQALGAAAAALGLTAMQAQTLVLLDPSAPPPPMGEVADRLACEPSNLSHIVNRLAELGYVERTAHPDNRRIKMLSLTGAGLRAREQALTPLHTAPAALRALPEEDQRQLCDLLRRSRA